MILTGMEIMRMVLGGRITIDPFNPDAVQPNSYDLHLMPRIGRYMDTVEVLDPRTDNPVYYRDMPEEGTLLYPGDIYLCSTLEVVGSKEFVPKLDGKSSLGRLGIKVHLTAGFGDLGFINTWTLEVEVTRKVILYPRMPVCQVSFSTTLGDRSIQYRGRYREQDGPTPSRMWQGWQADPSKD
jgi:dCTP deaminase